MSTLIETFTSLADGSWDDAPVAKHYDIEVVQEYSTVENSYGKPVKSWPGPQKNVYAWVVLVNGKAVGWNENPGKGWSFPVVKYTE